MFTRRRLQIILGALWLLDGALQLQPSMFTSSFSRDTLASAAAGQPAWVAHPVLLSSHLVGNNPIPADLLFAVVQLALGAGLLWRRTARVALVASVAWAVAVWYLGEGLGGLASLHASLLTGFPGAVILYGALALGAWTSQNGGDAHHPPSIAVPITWVTVWVGGAVVQLLPGQASASNVPAVLAAAGGAAPTWIGRIDHGVAMWLSRGGSASLVLVVGLELAIGIGTLAGRTTTLAASVAGGALGLMIWIFGEAFGQVLSGRSTDPNSGPLLAVLAVALASRALPTGDNRSFASTGRTAAMSPTGGRVPAEALTHLLGTFAGTHGPDPFAAEVVDVASMEVSDEGVASLTRGEPPLLTTEPIGEGSPNRTQLIGNNPTCSRTRLAT